MGRRRQRNRRLHRPTRPHLPPDQRQCRRRLRTVLDRQPAGPRRHRYRRHDPHVPRSRRRSSTRHRPHSGHRPLNASAIAIAVMLFGLAPGGSRRDRSRHVDALYPMIALISRNPRGELASLAAVARLLVPAGTVRLTIGATHRRQPVNVQLARSSVLRVSAAARSRAGIDAAYTFRVVDERAWPKRADTTGRATPDASICVATK